LNPELREFSYLQTIVGPPREGYRALVKGRAAKGRPPLERGNSKITLSSDAEHLAGDIAGEMRHIDLPVDHDEGSRGIEGRREEREKAKARGGRRPG